MDKRIGQGVMNYDVMLESIEDHQWFVDLCQQGYYKNVGEESRKTWLDKANNKGHICFWQKYTKGRHGNGLDIGYKGYLNDVVPILPTARGLTLDDYDGIHLPVPNNSQDYIYSSHVLEHIDNRKEVIKDWYRALKVGGFIICVVPHKHLYEKKESLPSRFNEDHKIFYTPSILIKEFEDALPTNSFRVRHLRDNDEGHHYDDPPEMHGRGLYEIEVVLEKIK